MQSMRSPHPVAHLRCAPTLPLKGRVAHRNETEWKPQGHLVSGRMPELLQFIASGLTVGAIYAL
ncbi:MAG: hypothetical protein QOD74_1362, partial [Variibacter sp.]|nr:hypothetical protein [Variibacter sp.]